MRIKKLTLKNWGPHEDLTLDMDTPVFGLIGPNFSGKSNIMTAIAFAFTGLLEKGKPQASYVRYKNGEDIPNGSVDLTFVRNGVEGRIFRQVGKTPSKKLWWDGAAKPITGSAVIEERLSQLLDCDKLAIQRAVFLSQGHLADFLLETPAKREEAFAEICLIDKLGLVEDIAAQEILRLQKDVTDLTSQRDEATQTREQAEAALRTSEGELALFPDRRPSINWMQQRMQLQKRLSELETLETLEVGRLNEAKERQASLSLPPVLAGRAGEARLVLEELQGRLQEARVQQQKATATQNALAQLQRCQARLSELDTFIEKALELTPKTLEVQAALDQKRDLLGQAQRKAAWADTDRTFAAAVESGISYVSQVETALAALEPKETLLERQAMIAEGRAAYEQTAFRLQLAKEAAGHVDGCCPLCGGIDLSQLPRGEALQTAIKEHADEGKVRAVAEAEIAGNLRKHEELASKLSVYRTALEERRTQLATHRAAPEAQLADVEATALCAQVRTLDAELSALRGQMSQIPSWQDEQRRLRTEVAALGSAEQLSAELLVQQSAASSITSLEAQHAEAKRYLELSAGHALDLANINSRLDACRAQQIESQDSLRQHNRQRPSGLQVTDDASFSILQGGLQELLDKQAQRDQRAGAIEANAAALRRAENRIQEIEDRARQNAATQTVIGYLEDLKNAFGRAGIARSYLTKIFDSLVVLTQENLAAWDTDFQVEKDPAELFNFLFCQNSDPETLFDQSQMSGGQRTRVALSFVQAIQSLLYPGLDFLCVDEPSNHLDGEGVEGLGRLLQTIALQNTDGESQVIVVDHNPLLQRSFSKCHQLKRGGAE